MKKFESLKHYDKRKYSYLFQRKRYNHKWTFNQLKYYKKLLKIENNIRKYLCQI